MGHRSRRVWIVFALACACGGTAIIDSEGGAGSGAAAGSGTTTGGSGGTSPCTNTPSNPDHCGRCGHSCLGGECIDGKCQPVVLADTGQAFTTAIAIDETHVYWASPLTKVPKMGAEPVFIAEAGYSVFGIAVDETHAYWGTPDVGPVIKVGKAGGVPVPLFSGPAYRIAVDESHVYFARNGVWKVHKNDGTPTQLSTTGDVGIAIDDEAVYFSTWLPGGVSRVAKAGGPVTELAWVEYSKYVATHGGHVYWTSESDGSVRRVPKNGGAVDIVAEHWGAYGIAVDDSGVYWTDFFDGRIMMASHDGQEIVTLATGQHAPRDITMDDVAVYWTDDPIYSAVRKIAKP